jgi:DNA invertase Pin-like site-specific DNA recombinase
MVNVATALKTKRGARRKTDPKKAVAYIRVSTKGQALGPQAQRNSIQTWADANGVEIIFWLEEQISGAVTLPERTGLFEAIREAEERRTGLFLVAKRDRFARDSMAVELMRRHLDQNSIELRSTDHEETNGETPEAQLLRTVMDAMAQYERALISARTKAALAAKKRAGLRGPGSIPFGKRLVGSSERLEDDPQETAVLNRIIRERSAGSSLQTIVDGLNTDQVPSRGKRWHRTTVDRILNAAATR